MRSQGRNSKGEVKQDLAQELESLLDGDKLGPIRWFESTQVVCFRQKKQPFNIYSLYAGETGPCPAQTTPFLTERFTPSGVDKEYRFLLARHVIPAQALVAALAHYAKTGIWSTGGNALNVGLLTALPTIFCPPDGSGRVALNGVLKNNFLNGSYVLELADAGKESLGLLLETPGALTELTERCSDKVRLDLDAVGDRVGNILIQLPVTAVTAKFRTTQANQLTIALKWHPDCTPRQVSGSYEVAFDGTIEAYGSRVLDEGVTDVAREYTNRGTRAWIWDESNKLLLAATSTTRTIGSFHIASNVQHARNRVVQQPSVLGSLETVEFPIWDTSPRSPRPPTDGVLGNRRWADLRIYRSSMARLQADREFVQYAGARSRGGGDRARALADIRFLITQHGSGGTYLWDPFLSAADVLATITYNPYGDADLRALTSGKLTGKEETPVQVAETFASETSWRERLKRWVAALFRREESTATPSPSRRELWQAEQKSQLDTCLVQKASLHLEFRIQFGSGGWSFHDRFLLFPASGAERARVWSLGISVNQLGESHHILQEVTNAQPVMDAFNELWKALESQEFLIWKAP